MTSMDYNIDHYTVPELLAILGLSDEDTNEDTIISSTDEYIARYTKEKNQRMIIFFQQMQTKLLQYLDQLENNEDADPNELENLPEDEQTQNWIKYEALPQKDTVQKDKNTDRIQKIDIYDNNHMPMNREQLGVANNFNVKVAQDTLNPNLENTTSRFINLDSQFRQASGGVDTLSTDYTLDLSDPLTNVLNLRLYSIQIPFTWYAIDTSYGNTCLWVTINKNTYKVTVNPGNYSATELRNELLRAFLDAGFTNPNGYDLVYYNKNNGKLSFYLEGWLSPNLEIIYGIERGTEIFNPDTDPYFTFYDFTGSKTCYETGDSPCGNINKGQTINNTLGWLLGFRLPIEPIYKTTYTTSAPYTGGNTPIAVLNIYGPKYLILVIDDYNQNHINNGLITITELSKVLPLPDYYNTSQPYICSPPVNNVTNLSTFGQLNDNSFANSLTDKITYRTSSISQLMPSAPRTLTQAQLYTVNEIIKNRNNTSTFISKAPTSTDTFALLPVKYGGMNTGDIYVDFSGSLQDNKRIYFGPVNISRLHIKLLDDKGNTLNLHGADWCITLISENLYQY